MKNKIDTLIELAICESKKPGAPLLLPDVVDVLRELQTHAGSDRAIRRKMAGALGRLILEDMRIAESQLGQDILSFAADF